MSEENSIQDYNDTSDIHDICKICNENKYKYCCPRCNILYCSLKCYRSPLHSVCSESFYKDCVTEEMASVDQNPESKAKMMEILTKIKESDDKIDEAANVGDLEGSDEELDSDDNEDVPDLAERVKDIDLDDSNSVWNALTEDEKKEFETLLQKDITHVLPEWKPWWHYREEKKLVTEIDETETKFDYMENCPTSNNSTVDFKNISKNPPADCVKYNLINVLSSYVYMVRMFNGDPRSLYNEAVHCFISLAANLECDANYDDAESAIMSVVQESYNHPTLSINAESQIKLKADLKCLLNGPEDANKNFYVNSALSDIYNLLSKAKSNKNVNKKVDKFGKAFPVDESLSVPRKKIKMLLKKIQFYQAYNNEFGNDMYQLV